MCIWIRNLIWILSTHKPIWIPQDTWNKILWNTWIRTLRNPVDPNPTETPAFPPPLTAQSGAHGSGSYGTPRSRHGSGSYGTPRSRYGPYGNTVLNPLGSYGTDPLGSYGTPRYPMDPTGTPSCPSPATAQSWHTPCWCRRSRCCAAPAERWLRRQQRPGHTQRQG